MDEEQIKTAGELMTKLFVESEKKADLNFAAFGENKKYIRQYIKDHGGDLYNLEQTEEDLSEFIFSVCFENVKKLMSCVVATEGIVKTFGLEPKFDLMEYVKTSKPDFEKLIEELMSDEIYYELILVYCASMSQLVFEKYFEEEVHIGNKISNLLAKLKK